MNVNRESCLLQSMGGDGHATSPEIMHQQKLEMQESGNTGSYQSTIVAEVLPWSPPFEFR